jgi:deazaflavin-dependent oxidoreductase (nitroreductase family)
MSFTETVQKAGATRTGVWLIKHVVSPMDRALYRASGGRFMLTQRKVGSVVLLTTLGWRSGKQHTTPVFHLRDDERVILCNVNPGFEKTNPWVLNLRAHPQAHVQIGRDRCLYSAREASPEEVEHYWPALTKMWPAYQTHYECSGRRVIFILEMMHVHSKMSGVAECA